jgi:acyl-CoA synthetase (NDP forming)
VFDAVRDCVENGKAKGLILFSSGFGEKGPKGKALQEEIVAYAKERGTRILGPNCMGFYAPAQKLALFPGLFPDPGDVGYISQSGSLAVQVTFAAALKGISFSKAISIGNQSDLDLCDFLEYLGWDPETKLISCYVEGIKAGGQFLKVAQAVSRKKPIIMWKVGVTASGSRAAQSHTGSIGGDEKLWDRVLEQAGIIRVNNMMELLTRIGAFTNPFLPKGNRVAIISGPGGPAVSSADACEKAGLELAPLDPETKQKMQEILPEFGTSVKNPVDLSLAVAFDEALNHKAAEIVGSDLNVDSLLIFISILQNAFVRGILKVQAKIRKPITLVCPIDPSTAMNAKGGDKIKAMFQPLRTKRVPETLQKLYKNSISVHITEQDAANTLAALVNYQKFLSVPQD